MNMSSKSKKKTRILIEMELSSKTSKTYKFLRKLLQDRSRTSRSISRTSRSTSRTTFKIVLIGFKRVRGGYKALF